MLENFGLFRFRFFFLVDLYWKRDGMIIWIMLILKKITYVKIVPFSSFDGLFG